MDLDVYMRRRDAYVRANITKFATDEDRRVAWYRSFSERELGDLKSGGPGLQEVVDFRETV